MSNDNMKYTPNDSLVLYVNQADREAYVLAVIGDEMLVEYEMPAGSSALVCISVKDGVLGMRRSFAYKSVPKKWIDAIRAADMTEWLGQCQRNGFVPFPKGKEELQFDADCAAAAQERVEPHITF